MLLWWMQHLLPADSSSFAAFSKITFRATIAGLGSFLIAVVLGGHLIRWLRSRFTEPNQSPSAEIARLHQAKHATPTMGGLFIIAGVVGSLLMFGRWDSPVLWLAMLLSALLCTLGVRDDLSKLRGFGGMPAKGKLLGQIVIATAVALLMYRVHGQTPGALEVHVPLASATFDLGLWYVPLAVLVIVGASNAVNLTDGLDGLAGGCLLLATAAMGIIAFAAGHAELAAYLGLPHIPMAGELLVLSGAMLGALMGFLWFNCHPAQVFMGDTGSLPLGGLLGFVAIAARAELLLAIVGGVFVVEALSVILQVLSLRMFGRRLFRCAPLHHHFQLKGWPESRIVVRFWIAAAICAAVGLGVTKVNIGERPRNAAKVVVTESANHGEKVGCVSTHRLKSTGRASGTRRSDRICSERKTER